MNESKKNFAVRVKIKDYDYDEIKNLIFSKLDEDKKTVKSLVNWALSKGKERLWLGILNCRIVNSFLCETLNKKIIPESLKITVKGVHVNKTDEDALDAFLELSDYSVAAICAFALENLKDTQDEETYDLIADVVKKIQSLFDEEKIIWFVTEMVNSCSERICRLAEKKIADVLSIHFTIAEFKCLNK